MFCGVSFRGVMEYKLRKTASLALYMLCSLGQTAKLLAFHARDGGFDSPRECYGGIVKRLRRMVLSHKTRVRFLLPLLKHSCLIKYSGVGIYKVSGFFESVEVSARQLVRLKRGNGSHLCLAILKNFCYNIYRKVEKTIGH